MVLDELSVPVVLAPLAGGPATVELALAVSGAGGLGFLAGGYRTAEALGRQIAELRSRTDRPFGVNVFVPPAVPTEPAVYAAYAERLRSAGAELGEPRSDDDEWEAKLALLVAEPPPVVSFVFGCPPADAVRRLRERGAEVWATVTSPAEAGQALAAGADALVAQGHEAGGHRAAFADEDDQPALGLIALLQLLAARTGAPLIGAGGIGSGRGLAAALAAGAQAGAVGSAFMRCPEAGTSAVHREALAGDAPTALTRAFTGRTARGIVNAFMRDHGATAPRAYPEVHHLTAPLRQAARERGDAGAINLWAGQAHELGTDAPAAEVVHRLAEEARAAAERARERLR
jgi:nitronate monooxygenase